jgi:hypothetical protein
MKHPSTTSFALSHGLVAALSLLALTGCQPTTQCVVDAHCLPTEACVGGSCVPRPADAGHDGGVMDAGPDDAGVDAGSDDAGPGDAGSDDAGADAGTDAGVDAGTGLGAACTAGTDCSSTFCVDGVCCEQACAGVCESCNLPSRAGFCDPVAANTDPDDECATTAASTCSTTGTCDGARSCAVYGATTACVAASCTGNVSTLASTCNGPGQCVAHGTQTCSPFGCDGANGLCRTSCSVNNDCAAGFDCAAGGVCKPALGTTCTGASGCASGFCVDGVCCESACAGTCEACNLSGSVGQCQPIAQGQDPANECSAQATSTCGTDGACDGARGCELYGTSTVCLAATCTGTTATAAKTCDGAGACVAHGTSGCGAYTCGTNGTCRTACQSSADCASGNYCTGNACVPKLGAGVACTGVEQCGTGYCVDGVCCQSACNGTCEACNLTVLGLCQPVPLGSDPANECSDTGAASCGTNGVCNGSRACSNYASGTTCAAPSCASTSSANVADTCDGQGTCVDNGTVACGAYACRASTGQCRTSCQVSADCASGYTCAGSICKRAQGNTCSTDAECGSGYCTDGVCCQSRCGGTCESCSQTGRAGFCDPTPTGTNPDGDCTASSAASCGTTGVCNGARACALYAVGTVCVAPSCSGTSSNVADTCNGTGTCVDNGTVACGSYACNGGTGLCNTTCSGNADCASGYSCQGNVCKRPQGGTCQADAECVTGYCTNGVCCNQRCNGVCQTCGGTGMCGGVPPTVVCVAAACVGDSLSVADTCNGSGTCVDNGTLSCGAYTCNPATAACTTSCSGSGGTSVGCAAGHTCVSGSCT